jgi:hypothetical protein
VDERSRKTQLPELSLSIVGKYYLNGPVSITVAPTAPPSAPQAAPCASAEAHWKAAEAIGTAAAYDDHLARFPSCAFASLAKARIDGLKQKAALAPTAEPRHGASKEFDGKWDVTVSCTNAGKALGYTRTLSATVAGGVFHAQDLDQGKPNWLSIDGLIPPDGKTTLSARGTTGARAYTVNDATPGTPYAYTIDALFERSRGDDAQPHSTRDNTASLRIPLLR